MHPPGGFFPYLTEVSSLIWLSSNLILCVTTIWAKTFEVVGLTLTIMPKFKNELSTHLANQLQAILVNDCLLGLFKNDETIQNSHGFDCNLNCTYTYIDS